MRSDERTVVLVTRPKVATSKAELLTLLRHHRANVIAAGACHDAENLRVFGRDYDGDEWSVTVLVDIDEGVHYGQLEGGSVELERATSYKIVLQPSSILRKASSDDPKWGATVL